MLNWKTFRYSLLHVLIVFMLFQRLFQETKRRKVDARVYGTHWDCVFSMEYMLNRKTSGQKHEAWRVKYLYFIMLQIAMTIILFVCIQLVMNRSL